MANEIFYPPMASEYYGFGGSYAPLQPYISQQLRIDATNWLSPRQVIYNVYTEREKRIEKLIIAKRQGEYYVNDRNGRIVTIGELRITNPFFVNLKPDGTFDAFLCDIKCKGVNEPVRTAIPHRDYVNRKILPYMSFFPRNPDCPVQYIPMAFFEELQNNDDTNILTLPLNSGWQDCGDNRVSFSSAEIVIPQIKDFYASDILERKLIRTDLKFADAVNNLAAHLPNGWQYRFLVAIRMTSILLFFFEKEGLKPDQLFIIEPQSEANAKTAVALLKNRDCDGTSVYSVTECKTKLQQELNLSNDAMVVFRDSSLVEDEKRWASGMNTLFQDLTGLTGSVSPKRHMIAVVADNPGKYSSELPAFCITLRGCEECPDLPVLQHSLGELDRSLINILSDSDTKENLLTIALNKWSPDKIAKTIREGNMTGMMLRVTLSILEDFGLITKDDDLPIRCLLINSNLYSLDSEQLVCNEFREVLSACITQEEIQFTTQFGAPYYNKMKPMVVFDGKYVNFQARVVENHILPKMTLTKNRGKMLHALDACRKMHHNNNLKRNIEVETAPGINETLSVYSVTQDMLTPACLARIKALAYADYLFSKGFPDNFVPILSVGPNGTAGRVTDENTDAAESLYCSGQTRSGKTFFLTQQVLIRANRGEKVIVFDQTGAFSYEELCKHLSAEQVDAHFSFWNVYEQGLPVDLLSMEHCTTLPDKKNRLFSILSVAAKITGEVQGKVLRRRLSGIAKAIDTGDIRSLPQTLDYFDESDAEQAAIRARLEDVFEDLEGLETHHQNWGEFLNTQHKVIVISTDSDGIRKSSQLNDMLLANFYTYKQHDREPRYTVVLDELEDLFLEKGGPISTILRKGGKHRLSLLMASQEFSAEKDRLGKLIGNCGLLLFFRPKDADLSEISKHIGIERNTLARLEQGECVAVGGFYSHSKGLNCRAKLTGKTYTLPFHDAQA